ncbi:MAG: hypothetical protein ACI31F_06110 [Muribaculaceae bacterium]
MKKQLFFGLCLAAAISATAQISAVKEAERDAKDGNYAAAIEKLTPAFTHPETAQDAKTWFIAGKAGFDFYDNQYALKSLGKEADANAMGNALMSGYKFLTTALPLDSLPNEKGKIKPKYSKDILKLIEGHYNDFNNVAIFMWEAQNWKGAYDAWEMLINIPNDPVLGANAPKAYPDSTLCDIMYNQGLAAWQMDSLALSLACFEKAMAKGYDKKQIFDYAISHAAQLHNNEKVYELAEKAYKLHGSENPLYLQLMINGRIEHEQYDEASQMLDEAIAANPSDAQLYYVKGILFDSQKNEDGAYDMYLKAVELNPELAIAQYALGRALCNKAYKINDEAGQLANSEYQKVRAEKVDPLFREAADHLERALEIDPDNSHDVRVYLRNIYYNLGDEANLKRIEEF